MYNKVIKYDYKEKYYNMKKTVCANAAGSDPIGGTPRKLGRTY